MDFSLRCAWLLDAYLSEQMKAARKPNAAVQLLFAILYEKYRPKIVYQPSTVNGGTHPHSDHRLDEEDLENGSTNDDEMKSERAFSDENVLHLPGSRRKGHQKSRSDVSGKTCRSLVLCSDRSRFIFRITPLFA